MDLPLRILIWNENVHESILREPKVLGHYPHGIHSVLKDSLQRMHGDCAVVDTATLAEAYHGLTEERLATTDVLLWWGHEAHNDVDDSVVERVIRHVYAGMGIIVLHSGHFSKVFKRLMGTTCSLRWRNDGDAERVWTVAPTHPIAKGIPHPILIPHQEMYGEYFDIPEPAETIFLSTFSGGEVFRSGITYRRGLGKIFYFSPGDQDYPVYHHPDIQRVLGNATTWAAPITPRTTPLAHRSVQLHDPASGAGNRGGTSGVR